MEARSENEGKGGGSEKVSEFKQFRLSGPYYLLLEDRKDANIASFGDNFTLILS